MTVRHTTRAMAGMPSGAVEVVLGTREGAISPRTPSVTVTARYREHWCFTDARVVRDLIDDLLDAADWLEQGEGR